MGVTIRVLETLITCNDSTGMLEQDTVNHKEFGEGIAFAQWVLVSSLDKPIIFVTGLVEKRLLRL